MMFCIWGDDPGRNGGCRRADAQFNAVMASHTNRELELMLAGVKPLAAFLLDGALAEEDALGGQPFASHVAAGRIVRFERPTNDLGKDGQPMRRLLFALPGEEWRFEPYIALMDSLKEGWSNEKERQEGTLLGYSDAENDAHIARLVTRKP